jgi:membrane-bound serine protease (ClpP class)
MGSLALLYAEITNPGLLVPGVIGSVGLLISLVSFHKLDVEWGGVALLLLGLGLLIAELFIASFGILGIGGIVALTLGSIFLFTPEQAGFSLPVGLILSVVGVVSLIFGSLGYLAMKSLRFKSIKTEDAMLGQLGVILNENQVQVRGDIWSFVCDEAVSTNDEVIVLERNKLTLKVKKK